MCLPMPFNVVFFCTTLRQPCVCTSWPYSGCYAGYIRDWQQSKCCYIQVGDCKCSSMVERGCRAPVLGAQLLGQMAADWMGLGVQVQQARKRPRQHSSAFCHPGARTCPSHGYSGELASLQTCKSKGQARNCAHLPQWCPRQRAPSPCEGGCCCVVHTATAIVNAWGAHEWSGSCPKSKAPRQGVIRLPYLHRDRQLPLDGA